MFLTSSHGHHSTQGKRTWSHCSSMATTSGRHSSFSFFSFFFGLIHTSVWDWLLSEKSFKYLHVSEVLSVKKSNTYHGQVMTWKNKTKQKNSTDKHTKKKKKSAQTDEALQGSFDVLKLNFTSKLKNVRIDRRGSWSDTIWEGEAQPQHNHLKWQKESKKIHSSSLYNTTSTV